MNYVALHAADFVTARDADVWAAIQPYVDDLRRRGETTRTVRQAAALAGAIADREWQTAHPRVQVADYLLPDPLPAVAS